MKKTLSVILSLAMLFALCLPASADASVIYAEATADTILKYGNVTLSVTCEDFFKAGYEFGDVVNVKFLDKSIDVPFCSNYSDVDSGTAAVFARQEDEYIVLAINMGDFASSYGIANKTTYPDKSYSWSYCEGVDGPVEFTLSLREAGGYYDEFILHKLVYTDAREDYPQLSDAEFANFRAVNSTGMGKNKLYRTSSPVNPEHNRNKYADKALREAGVTVVMNLADSREKAESFEGYGESYYSTIKYIPLNMGMDFAAEDFRTKLADGLRYFASNPGVYAVHCAEGKDRAGFVTALLECFMGASADEIVEDYMVTYYNYYGVEKNDERYDRIANGNIVKTLSRAFDVGDIYSADLKKEAEEYFGELGLTEDELDALRANLSDEPESVTYVVRPGDCLWNLARKYYGSGFYFGKIADANGISSPYIIEIGQKLVIPK